MDSANLRETPVTANGRSVRPGYIARLFGRCIPPQRKARHFPQSVWRAIPRIAEAACRPGSAFGPDRLEGGLAFVSADIQNAIDLVILEKLSQMTGQGLRFQSPLRREVIAIGCSGMTNVFQEFLFDFHGMA